MTTWPAHLTQQNLIARLKDELGIRADSDRVHAWIREGCPLAPKGGKKPRFIWETFRAWLLAGTAPVTPMSQQIRNHLFRTSMRKGA
jgi:hypothetical protein